MMKLYIVNIWKQEEGREMGGLFTLVAKSDSEAIDLILPAFGEEDMMDLIIKAVLEAEVFLLQIPECEGYHVSSLCI